MQRSSPRPAWADVPSAVRTAVERLLGSQAASAESRSGGWSPGTADVLLLEDGRRVFVKSAGAVINPTTVAMHRREAAVLGALAGRGVAPGLMGVVEVDGWIALAVEHVDGRHPDPRSDADTVAVLDAVAASPVPIPADVPPADESAEDALADGARDWIRLLDSGRADSVPGGRDRVRSLAALAPPAGAAVAGNGLVHLDLRPDNVLVRDDGGALLIDWPNAVEGAPWLDALTYALDVRRLGGAADRALRHPVLAAVDPWAIDAVLSALAGYFFHASLRPEPLGMRGIRAFQRAQGEIALDWIEQRARSS